MEKLSRQITEFVLHFGNGSNYNIIYYGIQRFLETSFAIIAGIIIGIVMKSTLEVIFFLLVFSFLRSTAGGFHCEKFMNCFFLSCSIIIFVLYIIKNIELSMVFWLLLFIGSSMMILKCGIMENHNIILTDSEKNYFYSKLKINIFILFVIIIILFLYHQEIYVKIIALSVSTTQISQNMALIKQKMSSRL